MNVSVNLKVIKKYINNYLPLLAILSLFGCEGGISLEKEKFLQTQIDTLQKQLEVANEDYKPELGEIMSRIQLHHARLWFAATNENWKLAGYEIHEIQEAFEKVAKLHPYHDDQSISQILPEMILQQIDNTSSSIKQKNIKAFTQSFNMLTNSCNNCHRTTHHDYIVIKTPESPPVNNQIFTPVQP